MTAEPRSTKSTPDGPYSSRRIRDGALLLLTCVGLFLCAILAQPFLSAITWALALAVVAQPLNRRMERWMRPAFAASVTVTMVVVVLLAPGALLVSTIIDEAGGTLVTLTHKLNAEGLQELAQQFPLFGRALEWLQARFDLQQELKKGAVALAGQASALVGGSIRAVTQFVLMLVTLFFFLRDRVTLLNFLRRLVPLSRRETTTIFTRMSTTIQAILYGNLLVCLAQGTLGGLMFWILGLPVPVLCGAAMTAAAVFPMFGTAVVWVPAAIFLLVTGSWVKAIVLIAWGSLVVSLIDNVLYPILVAGELRLHTLGVLFSLFGGILAFGLTGIVLGPVILAATVAMLEVWRLRTEREDHAKTAVKENS